MTRKKEPKSYTVRFTLPRGPQWQFRVMAQDMKEAELLAKVKAGQQNIPVLECKVEVL